MAITQLPPPGDVPFVAEQILEAERAEDPRDTRRRRRAQTLRPILWRLHFVGGFLVGPIVISLALSGILFAWNPQIDGVRFSAITAPSSGPGRVALSEQVRAAQAAHPTWAVHSVVPGHEMSGRPDLNTAVLMDPPGGTESFGTPDDGVNVYVDQATGRATGEVAKEDTAAEVLRTLHSSWTLGAGVEPLTELAGAWFLVSLLTGLYLWWPGLRRRGTAAFAFRRRVKGRRQSKDLHNVIGVALVVPMLFVAVTGLTWTQFSGERYEGIKQTLAIPEVAGAESALAAGAADGTAPANIDRVSVRVAEAGLQNPVRISAPADAGSGWVATSEDVRFPVENDQLVVNGATGAVTASYDASQASWFDKLTNAGIAFHQAELFGVPLQLFMTLLALGVIALVLSGYKMWWQRRPQGGMGAPPPLRGWVRNAPLGLLVIAVVLAWLLPTLALALVVWLVLERAFTWAQLARGRPTRAKQGPQRVPLRPGVEAYKAAGVAVLGLAMVLGPGIGDGDETLATIPRLLAWAWSVPLGAVFLACGAVGLYAMFKIQGKPRTNATEVVA